MQNCACLVRRLCTARRPPCAPCSQSLTEVDPSPAAQGPARAAFLPQRHGPRAAAARAGAARGAGSRGARWRARAAGRPGAALPRPGARAAAGAPRRPARLAGRLAVRSLLAHWRLAILSLAVCRMRAGEWPPERAADGGNEDRASLHQSRLHESAHVHASRHMPSPGPRGPFFHPGAHQNAAGNFAQAQTPRCPEAQII